jgi:tRNA(fMet)-specific endonuclease VapC
VYLLDTDITSNLLDVRRANPVLRERVRQEPFDSLAISIITVDEVLRGMQDRIRYLHTRKRSVVAAYSELLLLYQQLNRFALQPYSESAERIFDAFPPNVKRVGVNDCRIAAIAIVTGCTLITANTNHFRKIPGLSIEDWTQE